MASRVLNPNEGRSWLDLAPYDGGNEFANPNITTGQPDAKKTEGAADASQ